jgi:hypothetical protein
VSGGRLAAWMLQWLLLSQLSTVPLAHCTRAAAQSHMKA